MQEMEHFSTRLTKGLKKELKVEAAKLGVKTQDLVSTFIKNGLQNLKEK